LVLSNCVLCLVVRGEGRWLDILGLVFRVWGVGLRVWRGGFRV
jgi:hypothetical protein